jgi:hypothetical protein
MECKNLTRERRHLKNERAGVKLRSWPEIRSDGDVLLAPYVPKGITGEDDDDLMHYGWNPQFLNVEAGGTKCKSYVIKVKNSRVT